MFLFHQHLVPFFFSKVNSNCGKWYFSVSQIVFLLQTHFCRLGHFWNLFSSLCFAWIWAIKRKIQCISRTLIFFYCWNPSLPSNLLPTSSTSIFFFIDKSFTISFNPLYTLCFILLNPVALGGWEPSRQRAGNSCFQLRFSIFTFSHNSTACFITKSRQYVYTSIGICILSMHGCVHNMSVCICTYKYSHTHYIQANTIHHICMVCIGS